MAEKLGFNVGDIQLTLDGQKVTSGPDLTYRRANARSATTITLRRGEQEITISLPPGTLGIVTADEPEPKK